MTRYIFLYIFFFCLLYSGARAQKWTYNLFKEKVYLHTNHVFFVPGDVVYYKIYLVNAQSQKPSTTSKAAYVEILNPAGNVIKKQAYKIEDGYAEGSYEFGVNDPGGIYKLRAYTNLMRNENDSSFFVKELTVQKVISPRILMKLEFPRKGYGAGDEVTAAFSVRSIADKPLADKIINYKVSIAGKEILKGSQVTNTEGKLNLKFELPAALNSNDGLLNITVAHEGFTETISRSIPIVLNNIDLQLLPEGGTLVAGLPANIAFKAVNEFGKPVDVSGTVINNSGQTVATFNCFYGGMGQFMFIPKAGENYKVKITRPLGINKEYIFPAFTNEGLVMHLEKEGNKPRIAIHSTIDVKAVLRGTLKDKEYYRREIDIKKGTQTIDIDTVSFPAGIAQFTIQTDKGIPVAERLVYLNPNSILQVKITPRKQLYLPREKVVLDIITKDDKGNPVPSNLSLSVVDDKLWTFADDKQDHILSWLLLSSELKGKVDDPEFYFRENEPKARPALDLVMLTNGYRYFDYIPEVNTTNRLKFYPDENRVISGIVLNEKKVPVKAEVFLIDLKNNSKALRLKTNKNGGFYYSNLQWQSTYFLIAHSIEKKEIVTINLSLNGLGPKPEMVDKEQFVTAAKEVPKEKDAFKGFLDDFGKDAKGLNEVVVVGYGVQRKQLVTGAVSVVKENAVFAGTVQEALAGRVAGIIVTPQYQGAPGTNITIRGSRSFNNVAPLIIVDGVPYNGSMQDFNANNINSITVLKDAEATAIYGSRAAGGVILISSKTNENERIKVDLGKRNKYATLYLPWEESTFAVARRFYVPAYTSVKTNSRTDFRETIYWNPVVQTDESGSATLEFYNSDATTTFRAIAEGIGWNGKPGRTETTWATQSMLQLDIKIPENLSVGDKPLIPLVIKNNGTENLLLKVNVKTSSPLSATAPSDKISVSANTSKQVLIPAIVMEAGQGDFIVSVSDENNNESVTLPFKAIEKGFPIIKTIAGDQSAHQKLEINNVVPGSLKSSLKVYGSLEGQLLDGIADMLREPHGCFEQTSSTTYPNILILKFLKETGKVNRSVESAAMHYIEAGYSRLTSYETAVGGFEWFGHTPPHEALTAYGLLEFMEMNAFINVDKNMLERTRKFLLGRRDGKGGFLQSSGGYDKFASVPNSIANIYIVYALSKAGLGNEIEMEYETAVKQAIASDDDYQLAMMALAANYMKNQPDYNRLMYAIQLHEEKKGLSSATSVVNSRDNSLKVETNALYALALCKAQNPNIGKIAMIISKILASKNYYGYGSTQSTVLALEALIEYIKVRGQIEESKITFSINGTVVPTTLALKLSEGSNIFKADYHGKDPGMPYCLEVSYNSFLPDNSPNASLKLKTLLSASKTKIGETVRLQVSVQNQKNELQPMAIAKLSIPAGLSVQPWQLKELIDKKGIAYYEIFDGYLVIYWMGMAPNETKILNLDLKADVPGTYKAKASNCYLYYTPEHKNWNEGVGIEIEP